MDSMARARLARGGRGGDTPLGKFAAAALADDPLGLTWDQRVASNLNGIFNRAPWWPREKSEDMSMEIVVKNKDWPGIREAVDYLERHGIPESKVRAVNIYARAGEPMEVTFTLALNKAELEPEPEIVRLAAEEPTEGRTLIGPARAHLDGPCSDACYE